MPIEGTNFRTIGEIVDEWNEDFKEWQKTHKRGCVTYIPEDDIISIRTEEMPEEYLFTFDRIQSAVQFTDWIWQINAKSWCNGKVLKDFLSCLKMVILEKTSKSPQGFYVWSE
jgi:hypothetical protein